MSGHAVERAPDGEFLTASIHERCMTDLKALLGREKEGGGGGASGVACMSNSSIRQKHVCHEWHQRSPYHLPGNGWLPDSGKRQLRLVNQRIKREPHLKDVSIRARVAPCTSWLLAAKEARTAAQSAACCLLNSGKVMPVTCSIMPCTCWPTASIACRPQLPRLSVQGPASPIHQTLGHTPS